MTPEMAVALALLSPAKDPPKMPPVRIEIPAVPKRAPQRMPAGPVVVPAGWHVHRCAHGHEPVEWAHPDTSRNNVHLHTCPVCGMIHWDPVRHGPTTLATTPVVQPQRPLSGGWVTPRAVSFPNCPPGRT